MFSVSPELRAWKWSESEPESTKIDCCSLLCASQTTETHCYIVEEEPRPLDQGLLFGLTRAVELAPELAPLLCQSKQQSLGGSKLSHYCVRLFVAELAPELASLHRS